MESQVGRGGSKIEGWRMRASTQITPTTRNSVSAGA